MVRISSNYKIINGDALTELQLLADNSVDCCVTSPPYYMLRDYGVDGQIGLENSPEEYISKLVEVFREVRRVLKPEGVCWLNIADSYAGSGKGRNKNGDFNEKSCHIESRGQMLGNVPITKPTETHKPKELIGIPFMLALALKADGWYLRQDIIWHKPNPMPESVKDRCTRAHEYIFMLTKSRKYYYNGTAIMELCVTDDRSSPRVSKGTAAPNSGRRGTGGQIATDNAFRNKRDVWTVAAQGLNLKGNTHFATFPIKLIEPCILAGCPEDGVVLDPFAGSGTVGIAAAIHGRSSVLIELNKDYCNIIEERIRNNGGAYEC